MIDSIDWTDTTPLRLKIAAERAFPGGGMTASGLRREADRGRLIVERIAGKDYTTMQAIADMRKLCRVSKSQPRVSGRSHGDEALEGAQGRALAKLEALRNEVAQEDALARMIARRNGIKNAK
ncbi:excisionase [Bradyrhizobium sp. CB82]|uniref:excisionase n=1 Tax=Bradyrhizobium sp. CB82 TaxID=3039159 RepID=UPI0024B23C8E|nr:excisionase [Bradyrhizobium sp. CB82]WFU37337.1 excisionase [Bradyrhizobium sp. CB82]